ncbi:hypothetical protein CVIRNUC_010371 [Coccomyxa viridis]|uniref:Uncharacterized protein n=1 Tax=Coccomyxa viridis TaxID=1274662 RepID=A0AAV1ILP4_9CHLO|nr:hypothetical protein CVIRNUC_010371 [Coccomyxa viridis]
MRTVQRLASLMRRCARHEGLPTMGTGAAALACGLAHSRACQVTDAGLSGPSTYLGCTTSSLDLPSMGIGCAEPALSRSFATTVTFHAKDGKSGDEGSHANSCSASDASADAPDAAPGSSILDEGFALADFDAETEAFTRQV